MKRQLTSSSAGLGLFAGSVAAALPYPLLVGGAFLLSADVHSALALGGWVFLTAFLVAGTHAVLLGLPAFWALSKLDLLTLPAAVVAGAVIGAGPLGVLYGESIAPLAAVFGAIGASAFWGVLPDKRCE